MGVGNVKKIFIFTAVCIMLLPSLPFFFISPVNAQDFTIRTPTFQLPPEPELNLGNSEVGISPETKRLFQEYEIAAPNEKIPGKQSNQQGSGDKPCGWLDIPCTILKVLDGAVGFVNWLVITIPEYLFDWAVVANLNGAMYESGFVRAGWGISRDVANMFFIFFVLWMALATIFQFDSYSAKRLLPKLIIVALLVNFSLPIGLFVIKTTNAIGKVFYDTATGGDSLANQIELISKMTDTMEAVERNKLVEDGGSIVDETACKQKLETLQSASIWQRLVHGLGFAQADIDSATTAYNDCILGSMQKEMKLHKDPSFTFRLTSIFWKLIIGFVAAFVFFAGAIFFLVRYLSLTILLIFGPIAFLFMMLPGTQEHWNKWWNKLIQWSFFAPVFLFMIMLSLRTSSAILPLQVQAQTSNAPLPSLALQYILVIGLFIASLTVANSMGIAMSGTVVGWGRSMARGAGRYAKGKGIQYAKIGAGGLAGGIQSNALLQKTLSSIPLLGGSIARGLGATRAMGEVAEKQRQRQKFGFAEKLSDEARGNYIASERAGVARDLLTKMDEGDRRRTVNALSTQGQIELAQKLRSVQSESLVGNTTNNPEVYARLSGEAGPLDSKGYLEKVAKIAHDKFQAKNLAPDFLRGATGREYLKTATEDELKAIAGTRQGAEALGNTLAEVARTIHEEVTDARADMQQRSVPYDLKQLTQTIGSQHLSPQTQQYLNTAPGMYEGRMAMKTRGGGENDREDEDEQFFRRIRKASQRGLFQQPEN